MKIRVNYTIELDDQALEAYKRYHIIREGESLRDHIQNQARNVGEMGVGEQIRAFTPFSGPSARRQEHDPDFTRSLNVGDRVGVYEMGHRHVYNATVRRITPTGLIKLGAHHTFRPNGYQRDPVYNFRYLGPPLPNEKI